MMKCKHENLMPLLDFKKDNEFAYLIMPLAEESLEERI